MTVTLQGLSYPLRLNGKGGLSISTDIDRIREQILEILDTKYFERVLRSDFGTEYLILSTPSKGTVEASLAQSLERQLDPQIKFRINLEPDESGTWYTLIQWWTEEIPEQSLSVSASLI